MYTKATMLNWIISCCFILCILTLGCNNEEQYKREVLAFQQNRNNAFLDPASSPFTQNELKTFKGLRFAEVNKSYCVNAQITWLPFPEYRSIQQSDGSANTYMHAAIVAFVLLDSSFTLNGYQTQQMREKRILFIPFTDASNGRSTYHGGRYIDLAYVDNRKEVVLDFNLCYAPLCAYVSRFSCPKVPLENNLPIQIEAGEMGLN